MSGKQQGWFIPINELRPKIQMALTKIVSGGQSGVERRDLDIMFPAGVDPLRCAVSNCG
jgi:hypothetical protein